MQISIIGEQKLYKPIFKIFKPFTKNVVDHVFRVSKQKIKSFVRQKLRK